MNTEDRCHPITKSDEKTLRVPEKLDFNYYNTMESQSPLGSKGSVEKDLVASGGGGGGGGWEELSSVGQG